MLDYQLLIGVLIILVRIMSSSLRFISLKLTFACDLTLLIVRYQICSPLMFLSELVIFIAKLTVNFIFIFSGVQLFTLMNFVNFQSSITNQHLICLNS